MPRQVSESYKDVDRECNSTYEVRKCANDCRVSLWRMRIGEIS